MTSLTQLKQTFDAIFKFSYNPETTLVVTSEEITTSRTLWRYPYDKDHVVRVLKSAFAQLQALEEKSEIHRDLYECILAAQRVVQVFAVKKSGNSPISYLAKNIDEWRSKHFHWVIGRTVALQRPQKMVQTREPYVKKGRYSYKKELNFSFRDNVEIFLLTQVERIASAISELGQKILSAVRISTKLGSSFHYHLSHSKVEQSNKTSLDNCPIAYDDAPIFSSYWLGHATCFFSVPVDNDDGNQSHISIITDPVDGDLNALFYPRMAEQERSVDQCPPIHICLLSHNHIDHFSPTTLKKLLGMDPLLIVPKGDALRVRKIGFRAVEMGWFDQIPVQVVSADGNAYTLDITATPANHTSGNLSTPTNKSLFNGYIIQSPIMDGDIYFAGDTARLDRKHTKALRDNFNIKYSFQPGGPDERRKNMEKTHQSSADALAMHAHLMITPAYTEFDDIPSFDQLKTKCDEFVTQFMHTQTFKLGCIHFHDTKYSIDRMHTALKALTWDEKPKNLKSYEEKVFWELRKLSQKIHLQDGCLQPFQLRELLIRNVVIPKAGETTLY